MPVEIAPHLRQWIDAAADLPEVHDVLRRFYEEDAPRRRDAQMGATDDRVGRAIGVPVGPASEVAAACARLTAAAVDAGVEGWPPPVVGRSFHEIARETLYARTLPMTGTFAGERAALREDPRSDDEIADRFFGAHLLHEIAHGPARAFPAAPSMMALEAAAAWLGWRVAPSTVLASVDGPFDAVPGLRQFLILGRLIAACVGERALTRYSLGAASDAEIFGERLARLLVVADWQAWLRTRTAPLAPDGRDVIAWCRLVLASRIPGPWDEAFDEASSGHVTAGAAHRAPDLLAVAGSIPTRSLADAWPAPRPILDDLLPALACVDVPEPVDGAQTYTVRARRSGPGALFVDPRRGVIGAPRRSEGVFGEPAEIPVPGGGAAVAVQIPAETSPAAMLAHAAATGAPPPTDRTVVELSDHPLPIRAHESLFLLGSCFADNLAKHLSRRGVDARSNPHGVVYDPGSLARTLDRLLDHRTLVADDARRVHGRYVSFDHHPISAQDSLEAWVEAANQASSAAASALDAAGCLVLTLGTARVHHHRPSGRDIANRHGLPAAEFSVRRLEPAEISDTLEPPLRRWLARRPGRRVVLTVSPIRHLGDGLVENSRSKAALQLGAEALAARVPGVSVFPAFEILIDELRDYRYATDDLVHPTDRAVTEVVSRFVDSHFDAELRERTARVGRLLDALYAAEHRDTPSELARLRRAKSEAEPLPASLAGEQAYLEGRIATLAARLEHQDAPAIPVSLPPAPPGVTPHPARRDAPRQHVEDPWAEAPDGWLDAADTARLAHRIQAALPATPAVALAWFRRICAQIEATDDADGALDRARTAALTAACAGDAPTARWLTLAETPCAVGPVRLDAVEDEDLAASITQEVARRWPTDPPSWLRPRAKARPTP